MKLLIKYVFVHFCYYENIAKSWNFTGLLDHELFPEYSPKYSGFLKINLVWHP